MYKKIKHYTDTLNYELEKTAKVMKILGMQVMEKLKMELLLDEYVALDIISCHQGICQRDLAKLIIKDRANTGRILNSLEEKGFITRFVDTKNNRLVRKMAITENGYKMLININKKIESYIAETKKVVSEEELDGLYNSLKKVRERFEELIELKI